MSCMYLQIYITKIILYVCLSVLMYLEPALEPEFGSMNGDKKGLVGERRSGTLGVDGLWVLALRGRSPSCVY